MKRAMEHQRERSMLRQRSLSTIAAESVLSTKTPAIRSQRCPSVLGICEKTGRTTLLCFIPIGKPPAISPACPPRCFPQAWVIGLDGMYFSSSRTQNQVAGRDDFIHYPEFIDDILIRLSILGRVNIAGPFSRSSADFGFVVDNSIAGNKVSCHLQNPVVLVKCPDLSRIVAKQGRVECDGLAL